MLGTCIEGIRVEFVTPGFNEGTFYAIANARGPSAPRTNVARSGLEKSPELMKSLATIYSLYCDHVRAELVALRQDRSFSLTWAAREARYLLASLIEVSGRVYYRRRMDARAIALLQAEVDKVPFLVVEHAATRRAITPGECLRESYLWSIDCELIRSAETLLGESTSDSSMHAVRNALGVTAAELPAEPVLCAVHPLDPLARSMFDEREADRVVIRRDQRRVDVRWARLEASPRWLTFPSSAVARRVLDQTATTRADPRRVDSLRVGARAVEISGLGDETAVRAHGIIWIKHDLNIAQFLVSLIREAEESQSENDFRFLAAALLWVDKSYSLLGHGGAPTTEELIQHFAAYSLTTHTSNGEKFMGFAMSNSWRLFDPAAWLRGPHDFLA